MGEGVSITTLHKCCLNIRVSTKRYIYVLITLQKFYITTARQIRRIDSVRRSPIFAHFDESVEGATSIRAYGKIDDFVNKCDRLMDESQRAWYHVSVSMR